MVLEQSASVRRSRRQDTTLRESAHELLARRPMQSRWTFLFLLLTSACGARVVEEGDPIPPIPEETYCATTAKAYCPLLVDCCHAVKFDAEVAACEKNYVKSCEDDRRAKLAAGSSYDAKAASACLAAKVRYSKGCAVRMVPVYSMDDETWAAMTVCSQVWQGATPLGGVCSADSECAGAGPGVQVGCYMAPTASSGVCRTRRRLAEGEGCADDALDFCGGGLICAPSGGGARRCVRRGALGESCSPFAWPSCVDGLTCDPTTNTCAPPRPVGAACVAPLMRTNELDSTCVAPAECDSVHRVCVEPRPTGAACSSSSGVALGCKRTDYCEPATRKCAPRKLDGEPCTDGDECSGWRCSAGRCVSNGAIADAESCKLAK